MSDDQMKMRLIFNRIGVEINDATFSNTAQNHIFIQHFNFNDTWAGVPRQIVPKSSKNEIINLNQLNNFDFGARL